MDYLLLTGIEKKANDIIQCFAGSGSSLFDGLKKNFKKSTELILKDISIYLLKIFLMIILVV